MSSTRFFFFREREGNGLRETKSEKADWCSSINKNNRLNFYGLPISHRRSLIVCAICTNVPKMYNTIVLFCDVSACLMAGTLCWTRRSTREYECFRAVWCARRRIKSIYDIAIRAITNYDFTIPAEMLAQPRSQWLAEPKEIICRLSVELYPSLNRIVRTNTDSRRLIARRKQD